MSIPGDAAGVTEKSPRPGYEDPYNRPPGGQGVTGTTVLFVYGTLKRGGPAHRLLAGQTFLGDAETDPGYRLYDLGRYPGLVKDPTTESSVKGELWAVSDVCLAELDDYESAPTLYVREAVPIRGRSERVETYLYNLAIPPGARSGDFWPFGG